MLHSAISGYAAENAERCGGGEQLLPQRRVILTDP
jgi:hypothetical protein